jgi:hypothetical protein
MNEKQESTKQKAAGSESVEACCLLPSAFFSFIAAALIPHPLLRAGGEIENDG